MAIITLFVVDRSVLSPLITYGEAGNNAVTCVRKKRKTHMPFYAPSLQDIGGNNTAVTKQVIFPWRPGLNGKRFYSMDHPRL